MRLLAALRRILLSPEPASVREYEHLRPLVEALLASGNELWPHPHATDIFWSDKSGHHCRLVRPIDFKLLDTIAMSSDVTFSTDKDCISCPRCWATIYGGDCPYVADWR